MDTALWIVAALLVVVGMLGVVLPALPGAVLVFAGLVLAAWLDGFERVGVPTVALLAGLTALAYVVEFAASAWGAQKAGASRLAVWGAAAGAVVGIFFGLPGLLLGPFAGAVGGEYLVRRRLGQAGRAGAGAWLGLALSAVAKVALVFMMLGLFFTAYFF